jgi:ABC-type transport system involved in cytochrome c biogenesis permease component
MNARMKLLGVLVRKDLRVFWALVVPIVALNVFMQFDDLVQRLGWVGAIAGVPWVLTSMLLIFLLFHEDAAAGVKSDWMTRPMPGMVMLASKCVSIVLVILLPSLVAAVLNAMHEGYALREAVVAGVAGCLNGTVLTIFLCVMALAALTANIRQGLIALVLATLVGMFAVAGVVDLPQQETSGYYPWMVARPLQVLMSLGALAVLWMQYRRRGNGARVLAGVVVLVAGTYLFTMVWLATTRWPRLFAVQEWLSPDPAAESSVAVSVSPGCFPARTLEMRSSVAANGPTQVPIGTFPEYQWAQAGADAVAFSVRLVAERLPEGGLLALDRAELTYRTAGGVVAPVYAARITGQWASGRWVRTDSGMQATDRYWMLSKPQYEKLAADPSVTTHIEYSLSLLAPSATAVFNGDGKREFREGIGYCGAHILATGVVTVNCYRTGEQPALLMARLEGQPDIESRASGDPDFTPAVLDFSGGRRHYIQFHVTDVTTARVQVTAYEARAHFTRQFDVPGVLGGPVSSCPVP